MLCKNTLCFKLCGLGWGWCTNLLIITVRNISTNLFDFEILLSNMNNVLGETLMVWHGYDDQ